MRSCTLIIVVLFFVSCSSKKELQEKRAIVTGKVLTIADLKFPLIDENNSEDNPAPFLPNPNKENLIRNRIYAQISEPEILPINRYPDGVIERFNGFRKSKQVNFSRWYLKNEEHSDTNFYDRSGNLTRYIFRNIMSSYWQFTYDSLGFESEITGGSCVKPDIISLYAFDNINRTLIQIKFSERDTKFQNFISTLYFLIEPGAIYKFDTSGYLKKMIRYHPYCAVGFDLWPVYMSISNFFYTADNEIDCVDQDFYILNGINRSTTKYYYQAHHLDSAVTQYTFMKSPQNNFVRRTYYNDCGLPLKTTFDKNISKFLSKSVVYKYMHY